MIMTDNETAYRELWQRREREECFSRRSPGGVAAAQPVRTHAPLTRNCHCQSTTQNLHTHTRHVLYVYQFGLIAQAIYLLVCGHTDTQSHTDATDH